MATYSLDILIDGTPSADSVYGAGSEADKACDNDTATIWNSANTAWPHWWKYDLGNSKKVIQLTLSSVNQSGGNAGIKNFTFKGSSDDTNWTTIYTGLHANNFDVQTYQFTNTQFYRYYRVDISDSWTTADTCANIKEVEMMTIIPQGGFFPIM